MALQIRHRVGTGSALRPLQRLHVAGSVLLRDRGFSRPWRRRPDQDRQLV